MKGNGKGYTITKRPLLTPKDLRNYGALPVPESSRRPPPPFSAPQLPISGQPASP